MKIRVAVPCSTVFPGSADPLRQLCDLIERKHPEEDTLHGFRELFHWSEGILSDRFFPEMERLKLQDFFTARPIEDFSFDLGPACRKVEAKRSFWGEYYLPAAPTLSLSEMEEMLTDRIKILRQCFRGRLVVELLPYYPTAAYDNVCKPEVVSHLIESADLLLLVDLAHAEVSARNMGVERHDYLNGLPLQRLAHIHLSRPGFVTDHSLPDDLKIMGADGIAVDLHDAPNDSDFDTAFQLAAKSSLDEVFVTIEYYDDTERLIKSYTELRRRADEWNSR